MKTLLKSSGLYKKPPSHEFLQLNVVQTGSYRQNAVPL